jgi:LPXTG-site transpeptidase (sortase) family protein
LDERNAPGAFAYIKELKSGDLIFLRAFGVRYVYQVEESALVKPNKVSTVFKHEESNWLTLVTCESFSKEFKSYQSRRVVRAVLISVLTD